MEAWSEIQKSGDELGLVKGERKFNFGHAEFKLFVRHSRNICEVLGKFSKSFIFTEKPLPGL